MAKTTQCEINLGSDYSHRINVTPKGYRGLSSFHKYWGKKPVETWRFLVENLTESRDLVLDPFLGSGMIAKECVDLNRRFIGFDINPICIELAKFYLVLPNYWKLVGALSNIQKNIESTIQDMYRISDGNIVTHILWKQGDVELAWLKRGTGRVEIQLTETDICRLKHCPMYEPKYLREICLFDNSRINSKKSLSLSDLFTPRALRTIDLLKKEIENIDDLSVKRALLLTLSASLGQMSKMVFAVSRRGKSKGNIAESKIEVGSWVIGYWRPNRHFEINAWNCFYNKARKLAGSLEEVESVKNINNAQGMSDVIKNSANAFVEMGDSEELLATFPSNSVNLILTDPPHGDRIPYLELSEMWNSVIGYKSDFGGELVVSNAKERNKDVETYNRKLSSIFSECSRILSQDGFLAVVFNARSKRHWNSLRNLESDAGLNYIGCYPMQYSAGSVVQDSREGGLKVDFVLLYGKNHRMQYKQKYLEVFRNIKNWSFEYPTSSN